MIKTIEIAPDIIAHELAQFIFHSFGTIETKNYDEVLKCHHEDDLRDVIREFLNS